MQLFVQQIPQKLLHSLHQTGKKGAAANKNGAHTVTTDDAQGIFDTVELLSEVPGDVTYIAITDGKVSALCYENGDDAVYYNGSNYEVV